MVSRRRFMEMAAATSVAGTAVGVGWDSAAAAAGTPFAVQTWQQLVGKSVHAVDSAGAAHTLTVAAVTEAPRQKHTAGTSFAVSFTAARNVADGLYRLRDGASGQVFLVGGTTKTATLVVNTVRLTG